MPNTKRDYRLEYQRYQSSPKRRKYRAQLNKWNRDHGNYAAHDHTDASHKNGKIVGLEDEHINRGRAGEGGRRKGVPHVFHKRRKKSKN